MEGMKWGGHCLLSFLLQRDKRTANGRDHGKPQYREESSNLANVWGIREQASSLAEGSCKAPRHPVTVQLRSGLDLAVPLPPSTGQQVWDSHLQSYRSTW